ncbi:hypothetical protein [Hyphomicrobium sp. CS1GBMeth3]|uniref:hypothetical protein n=1 Tax=Hyphomicrobium sp. CS1GBMeth3 TaxID=1892845 RepID=UPI000931A657|nr:hypothetical protein [Hyphomicrobium sp. CS1GBMeth3]
MEGTSLKSLVLGFIAGAIAYVTVHEAIGLWLLNNGYATRVPWSLEPSLSTGLPELASGAAWGGLWGAIVAFILGKVPRGALTFRGALIGLLGTAVVGVLVMLPLIRSEPPFLGSDVNRIWPELLIGAGFGAVTAWLYGFFTSGFRLP